MKEYIRKWGMNMEIKKCCRNCSLFPCTLEECDIHNEQGCRDFESTVQKQLKDIQMKLVKQDGLIWKFERID